MTEVTGQSFAYQSFMCLFCSLAPGVLLHLSHDRGSNLTWDTQLGDRNSLFIMEIGPLLHQQVMATPISSSASGGGTEGGVFLLGVCGSPGLFSHAFSTLRLASP